MSNIPQIEKEHQPDEEVMNNVPIAPSQTIEEKPQPVEVTVNNTPTVPSQAVEEEHQPVEAISNVPTAPSQKADEPVQNNTVPQNSRNEGPHEQTSVSSK